MRLAALLPYPRGIRSAEDLGQWLCVPLSRVVCLFQVLDTCLPRLPELGKIGANYSVFIDFKVTRRNGW